MRMAGRMLRFGYLRDARRIIILKLGSAVTEFVMRMPMSNLVRRYEERSSETEDCRDTQHGSGHLSKLRLRLHGGNPIELYWRPRRHSTCPWFQHLVTPRRARYPQSEYTMDSRLVQFFAVVALGALVACNNSKAVDEDPLTAADGLVTMQSTRSFDETF